MKSNECRAEWEQAGLTPQEGIWRNRKAIHHQMPFIQMHMGLKHLDNEIGWRIFRTWSGWNGLHADLGGHYCICRDKEITGGLREGDL